MVTDREELTFCMDYEKKNNKNPAHTYYKDVFDNRIYCHYPSRFPYSFLLSNGETEGYLKFEGIKLVDYDGDGVCCLPAVIAGMLEQLGYDCSDIS